MKLNVGFLSNIYAISVLKKFNVIFFGVFSTALLNRYLGPTNKGEYAYILSIANILVVIFNFGINLTYPNFKRRQDKIYLPIFQSLSITEFIFLLMVSIISYIVTEDMTLLIIILFTAIGVFRMQLNYYNLVENIRSHSMITIASAFFNFSFTLIVFFISQPNLLYAYIIYILKDLIIIIMSFKNLGSKIKFIDFDFKIWREITKFGIIPMYTTLLISINYKIDIIILGFMDINLLLIGLYSVGVSLAEYGWLIPDIFKDVMINKTARKDSIQNLAFSLRISSTIMIFIYIVLIFFGETILYILFGNDFLGAYNVTIIIFLGIYSMIFTKIIGTLYIAKGEWKFYATVLSISVVANLFLNSTLIPILGINGAAIASVISYTLAGAAFLLDFKKTYSFRFIDLVIINKYDLTKIISLVLRS